METREGSRLHPKEEDWGEGEGGDCGRCSEGVVGGWIVAEGGS